MGPVASGTVSKDLHPSWPPCLPKKFSMILQSTKSGSSCWCFGSNLIMIMNAIPEYLFEVHVCFHCWFPAAMTCLDHEVEAAQENASASWATKLINFEEPKSYEKKEPQQSQLSFAHPKDQAAEPTGGGSTSAFAQARQKLGLEPPLPTDPAEMVQHF